MANSILDRMITNIPGSLNPASNQVILALLTALANSDEFLETQTSNAKDSVFIKSATGTALDRIGASLSVSRPNTLGMIDEDFQKLIPILSLHPKQVKQAFYNLGDVFFGPLFSRANITTQNTSTFNLNFGDELLIKVDGGVPQTLKILPTDVVAPGLMTSDEVVTWMSRLNGVTVSILTDPGTGDESVNLRTNTPGAVGTLELLSSSAVGGGKLEFSLGVVDILDLGQRFSVYDLNPNELIIEIPSAVPTLRRTLLGSHHFHLDSTIEPSVAPANGIWSGSFLHDPQGTKGGFTISSQSAVLQSPIIVGDVLVTINVDDTSGFLENSGDLIFDFGRTEQEQPVSFLSVVNANTLSIDPAYVFQNSHSVGRIVNVLNSKIPLSPRVNGRDLSVYLPSPVEARIIVQELLEKLKAAGIILRFIVQLPKYTYRCDSPYDVSDNAPSDS